MNWMTSEAIAVLTFLLPGCLASKMFRFLTQHPKPDTFGWMVETLAFTAVIHAIMSGMLGLSPFDPLVYLAWTIAPALFLAIGLAWLTQRDLVHWLRRMRVTAETSQPSQWYAAFWKNTDCYVVLHLTDDRRLFGWPFEWPGKSDNGHFLMQEAEWLAGEERTELDGVEAILVPARDVRTVEFVKGKQHSYIHKG